MVGKRGIYIVKRDDDYDLTPEETLADAQSDHSIVETPISRNVVRALFGVVALLLVLLVGQAFRLQIVEGKRFAVIADQSRFNRYPVPALRGMIYDRNGVPLVRNVPVYDLVAVRSELRDPPTGQDGIFALKRNISEQEAIRFQTVHVPGIYVVSYTRREYPYGAAFAHVLGYTAPISSDELKRDGDHRYQHNDRVGRLGLEAMYESVLHGEPQSIPLTLDPTADKESPMPGGDLATTLNKDVQLHLYKAISDVFRAYGVRRGAVVVQNVQTGDVLGMVSMPAFDPNADLSAVLEDNNKPLFNRVISGQYPPGSTIKPLYALAGLEEHAVTPQTQVYAGGSIQVQSEVDPSKYYTFRDWKVHGWTDIRKAIADSVDVYFYALGGGLPAGYGDIVGLGVDTLDRYLKMFLADQKTGIDMPGETNGFVPTKEWKRKGQGEAWYVGDTYNISIGQGDLLVTPLWINTYISAIANGGALMKPHVVAHAPEVLARVNLQQTTWDVVRQGMRQTVTEGTGQILNDLPQPVAAKTGTAQIGSGRALNSLFTVYGPYDDPQIAMTVLVENIPQSQSLAMRVAHDFLMWYFVTYAYK